MSRCKLTCWETVTNIKDGHLMRVFSTDLEVSPGEYWDDWRRVMNM
jgi:hypothetical protein